MERKDTAKNTSIESRVPMMSRRTMDQFRNTFPLVMIDCRRSSVLRCIEFQEDLPLQVQLPRVSVGSLVVFIASP